MLGAVLVITLPFFALDFLSVRHLQRQDVMAAFTREGLRLGAAGGLLALGSMWAGLRGIAVSKRDPNTEETSVGHGLIVAQPDA